MLPSELAKKIDELLPKITPQLWWINESLYTLSVKHNKDFRTAGKGKRNICVLASIGIAVTDEKKANAELIVLLQNNIHMIRDALKHSTMARHGR